MNQDIELEILKILQIIKKNQEAEEEKKYVLHNPKIENDPFVKSGKKVIVDFQGLSIPGYHNTSVEDTGWRYGFVAITATGKAIYSDICNANKGRLIFKTPKDTKNLWMIVMGAPKNHEKLNGHNFQFPYKIRVR